MFRTIDLRWGVFHRLTCLAGAIAAVAVAAAGSFADDTGWRRWAVVASAEVSQTGLTDLLTAELSRGEGLELVERDDLRLATGELELDALFGAEAAPQRLKLGRLFGADALVLLSFNRGVEKTEEESVKLVISDCRYGARLELASLAYTDDRVETVCRECAARVEETRRRFAAGIRQLIGVTHLLSKNFLHDYDHLQAGYAYLLETALMGFPGVAVIETEEAQAIARELEIAGAALEDRVAPLFVGGEFEVTATNRDTEPTVRLFLRVTDDKQVRMEFHREAAPASEVPDIIRNTIAGRIVELAQQENQPTIGHEQQFALLTRRADTFSRFGGCEHAVGLREAALLMKPDDVDQQLALIRDYRQWYAFDYWGSDYLVVANPEGTLSRDAEEKAREALRQKRVAARLSTFRHTSRQVEDLVRRRVLNPREAGLLASRLLASLRIGDYITDPSLVEQCTRAAEGFFWAVAPLIPELDDSLRQGRASPAVCRAVGANSDFYGEPLSPTGQYVDWTRDGLRFLWYELPRYRYVPGGKEFDDRQTLDNLYRFLTEVATRPVPLSYVMSLATPISNTWDLVDAVQEGRLEANAVRRFYERLEETGRPVNVLYGRTGLIALRVYGPERKFRPDDLDACDRMIQDLGDLCGDDREFRTAVGHCQYRLEKLREEMTRTLGKPSQEKRHRLPENPIAAFDAAGRVRFEPVEDVQVGYWFGLVRCTQSLDVAWARETVYAMPARGVVRELFRLEDDREGGEPVDHIYSVHWDGQSIWIASGSHGIYVISLDGSVLGHVGAEEGLPPYESRPVWSAQAGTAHPKPLLLHPIAPGRCIAVGRMPGLGRVWIAEVAKGDGQPPGGSFAVNVFHTARKAPAPSDDESAPDPETIFQPAWLAEYRHPATPSRRWLLVGRSGGPLAVDIETLEVKVLPGRLWKPHCVGDGRLVQLTGEGILLLAPPKYAIEGEWVETSLVEWEPFRRPALRSLLLDYQGMIYIPGTEWRRIDPRDWTVQRLKPLTMPRQDPFASYSVSAHYGLVAWSGGGPLYRVLVEPEPTVDDDLAVVYPGVPPESLGKHHEAVVTLRALGASVDTRWGVGRRLARWDYPRPRSVGTEAYEWRTIAYLRDAWQGGDAGLRHLLDLYNLRGLYLVRTAVSDAGLETVGRIETLESLYLVETAVTDAGLAFLRGHNALEYLRLEGAADATGFSDAGLANLGGLPNLQRLTLYGSGFTDTCLMRLGIMPKLYDLWLFNTAITEPALESVDASRGGRLSWHQNSYSTFSD